MKYIIQKKKKEKDAGHTKFKGMNNSKSFHKVLSLQ